MEVISSHIGKGEIRIARRVGIAGIDAGRVGGQVEIALIRIDEKGIFVDIAFAIGAILNVTECKSRILIPIATVTPDNGIQNINSSKKRSGSLFMLSYSAIDQQNLRLFITIYSMSSVKSPVVSEQ